MLDNTQSQVIFKTLFLVPGRYKSRIVLQAPKDDLMSRCQWH